MNPIDFGGQRSKVKVTIDMYGNKLVNTIETKPSLSSQVNHDEMKNPIDFGVTGQRSRSQLTYMEISL